MRVSNDIVSMVLCCILPQNDQIMELSIQQLANLKLLSKTTSGQKCICISGLFLLTVQNINKLNWTAPTPIRSRLWPLEVVLKQTPGKNHIEFLLFWKSLPSDAFYGRPLKWAICNENPDLAPTNFFRQNEEKLLTCFGISCLLYRYIYNPLCWSMMADMPGENGCINTEL